MSKVTESKKLQAEAEQNTKAFNKRKDALGKELEEVKTAFEEKKFEAIKATSNFRAEDGIPYPENSIIVPNSEIRAIENDDSLVRVLENLVINSLVESTAKNPAGNPTSEGVA
nr:hypothetical protein CFP56_73120 [Quercus suber]